MSVVSATGDDFHLPPIREDIRILKGPVALDGSPTWNIYDPVRNKYFRIGWTAFQLLSRWGTDSVTKLVNRVKLETVCNITGTDVKELVEFLYKNSLTRDSVSGNSNDYLEQFNATKMHWVLWLIKNYLFIRIPLVRPNRFIHRTLPFISFIFGKVFRSIILVWGLLGLYLVGRQWDEFFNTFLYFFSLEGFFFYVGALVVIKIFHEFGHAYVAGRFGCNVSTMGVALLVMFPVLYTDTTDTWRLVSRKQRMLVGSAGMITEIYIALISTFLWSFLPDGIFKSIAFVFATTSWTLSVLVNTNVFMRFDGYYILSDWWGVENLQERAFRFGKWRLREVLFNLKLPMPEKMELLMAWKLTLYAWCVWIYRLSLFIGIALLVYHFFFKVLGIILFAVEIIWFILFPISKELRVWWGMRDKILNSNRFYVFVGILFICLMMLIIPINTTVSVPAILNTRVSTSIYSLVPAEITSINIQQNQVVKKGDVLLILDSPSLQNEIDKTISEIGLVSVRLNRRAANPEDLANGVILFETMQELQSKLKGLRDLQQELTIRAPISGKIVDIAGNLHVGRWINEDLKLASVIDPEQIELSAIIRADKLSQIDVNQLAVFLPSNPQLDEIKVQVVEIEDTNVQQISELYFSSTYGGDIAVREDATGRQVPENSSYRIRLIPTEAVTVPAKVEVGNIYIQGKAKSITKYLYETVASVLIRESGF